MPALKSDRTPISLSVMNVFYHRAQLTLGFHTPYVPQQAHSRLSMSSGSEGDSPALDAETAKSSPWKQADIYKNQKERLYDEMNQ